MPVQVNGRALTGDEIDLADAVRKGRVRAYPGVEHCDPDPVAPSRVVARDAEPFKSPPAEADRSRLGVDLGKLVRNRDIVVADRLVIRPKEFLQFGEVVVSDTGGAKIIEFPEQAQVAVLEAGEKVAVGLVAFEAHQAFVRDTEEKFLQIDRALAGVAGLTLAGRVGRVDLPCRAGRSGLGVPGLTRTRGRIPRHQGARQTGQQDHCGCRDRFCDVASHVENRTRLAAPSRGGIGVSPRSSVSYQARKQNRFPHFEVQLPKLLELWAEWARKRRCAIC